MTSATTGRIERATWLAAVLIAGCPDPGGSSPAEGTTSTTTGPTSGATTSSSSAADGSSDDASTTGPSVGPPPVPALASPADGAVDVALRTPLCWSLVDDPDGEPVRYRVWVDDVELTEGLETDPGHDGPCVGPLTFVHERTYAWHVEAFVVDDPAQVSGPSETWTFTTAGDGQSQVVFEDDFDVDRGWTVDGDAMAGAWVRGDPTAVLDGGALSQPTSCFGGDTCMFTAVNAGVPDDEDVAGGSTVLWSPPLSLGGAATATVELARFFYASAPAPSPGWTVELVVPGPAGDTVHPLEALGDPTAVTPENLWRPREYAACGVEMVDGTRLRITATDDGTGIVEAAIDSVVVRAHATTTVCDAGEGSLCDPAAGGGCPAALACCPQGVVQAGVYRCTTPVPGLDPAMPPPDPDAPGTGPLGCDAPDLVIDPSWIAPVLTDIMVQPTTCELLEGCLGDVGWRTILRFSLSTPNLGSRDLELGVPANRPDLFHYSECHGHHHFDEYARYELRDAGGGVVATGHKQAFCLLDTYSWAWPGTPGTYDCSNQGISRGFADVYESDLPCQWIDVTDVPPGEYVLRATLNQPRPESALPVLVERDYDNNVVEVPVTIP